MKPRVIVLAGPTASGKSSLACRLAESLPLEIINADSLQVFRYLDLGTAKPSLQLRQNIPHHLIDVLDPDQPVNAHWYAMSAREAIALVHGRGKYPLVVGGSGFYLRALEHPPLGPVFSEKEGAGEGHLEYPTLQEADPVAAKRISPTDTYRIQRALSILRQGELPSHVWDLTRQQEPDLDIHWFGLAWDRTDLYDRIHQRVREMFALGLVEETQTVLHKYPRSSVRLERALGYRQSLAYLQGRLDLEEAVEKTQTETRQYAKRQMTWFRKEARIHWHPAQQGLQSISEELQRILQHEAVSRL